MKTESKTAGDEILDLFKKHFDKFRYNPFYGSVDHFMKQGSVNGTLATEVISFAEQVASLRVQKIRGTTG